MATPHIRKIRSLTALSESAKPSTSDPKTGGRVYKGVTLIKAGLGNRRDKNYYLPETLKNAVEARMFEGLRAFADHPDSISDEIQPERTVRDLVGIYNNSRYDETRESVRADLTILKSHKWLSDTIDELIGLGHADKIGLSINGRGQTEPARRRIEEADGEEMDVNDVKALVDVRSNDIVTEAGAGGGFGQLLESARRAKETTPMSRKDLLAALREAATNGDTKAIKRLTKALEAEEAPAAGKRKPAREATKKKPAAEDEDDLEEADEDVDDEDAVDGEDHDDALEEAVDEAKADADEDDDLEESDEDEDDLEESDDDEESDLSPAEAEAARAGAMSAVARLRAQAGRSAQAREAAIKAGTGTPTGTIKSGGGSFVKPAKRKKKSSMVPGGGAKTVGGFKRSTGGAQTVESGHSTKLALENARLRKALEARDSKIANMSESLRVRASADRARKLLKESGLPKELLPELVRGLIGLSDADMQREISKTQRIIEAAANSVKADLADEFDEIEGSGSTLRESSFGGRRGAADGDPSDVLTDVGLTLRDSD